MSILKSVLALILFTWFVIITITVLGMPPMEHGMFVWALGAVGPIVVVAGLWEVCARIFGGRGK